MYFCKHKFLDYFYVNYIQGLIDALVLILNSSFYLPINGIIILITLVCLIYIFMNKKPDHYVYDILIFLSYIKYWKCQNFSLKVNDIEFISSCSYVHYKLNIIYKSNLGL